MKKIDFESHYYVRSYIDAASEHTGVPHYDKKTGIMYHGNDGFLPIGAILSRLLELGEQRLKDMDEAGVDKCFLFFFSRKFHCIQCFFSSPTGLRTKIPPRTSALPYGML